MTALDQAFIKAFSQQHPIASAVPRPAAAPGKGEQGAKSKERGAKNKRRGLGTSVPSDTSSSTRPDAAVPVPTATPKNIGTLEVSNPKSPIPGFAIPTPQLSVAGGVWAALEKPPKGATRPPGGSSKTTLASCGPAWQAVRSGETSAPQIAIAQPLRAEKSEPQTAKHHEPPKHGADSAEQQAAKANDTAPSCDCSAFSIDSSCDPQSLLPNPFLPFSSAAPMPAEHEFKAALAVDHFTWPRLCRRLIARAAEELDRLADALLAANNQGQNVLAIAGCRRGEGATTLLLCAARRLAERGVKPLMVDADLGRPRLAKRLGVEPELGWDETTNENGRRIDEAIVEATANNVALLPAREPAEDGARPAYDRSRLTACLKTLQNHYDLVLVDLGPLEEAGLADGAWSGAVGRAIDAVVLVHNDHVTSDAERTAFEEQLAAQGIAVMGIVENFVAED